MIERKILDNIIRQLHYHEQSSSDDINEQNIDVLKYIKNFYGLMDLICLPTFSKKIYPW